MKTLILTHYMPNYASLGAISDANKVDYCNRWVKAGKEYSFRAIVGDYDSSLPFGFQRIKAIKDIFESSNSPDVIFWQGSDTMITNPNISVEAITEGRHTRNYHFYITYDCHGINADSFIIRNTPWARDWLNFILSKVEEGKSHPWNEQYIMQKYWQDEKWLFRILALPQSVINSYLYDPLYKPWDKTTAGQFEYGDFLLHLPGMSLEQRISIFTSEWMKTATAPWEDKNESL
jgi:hypothetical protein